jgi:coenzyme PQQ synthesis protein D (PqqD)
MAKPKGTGAKTGSPREGEVVINKAKIGTGQVDGQFIVLHVPTDRFVFLYENSERIWKKIETGTRDIATLIKEHSDESKVTPEVAAFEVISFLDELRALDLVQFSLPKEREFAPLLDVQTLAAETRAKLVTPEAMGEPPKPRGKSRQSCKTMCVAQPEL